MTRNKKMIFSTATVVTAFAVMCSAGVTLALNSADSRSSGSLTTADLNLTATAKNVKAYSAVGTSEADSAFGNSDIGFYKYEQGTGQSDNKINFANHDGAVKFDSESISIENFMPGDKVEFDIEVTSTSTISFNYRAELYVNADEGDTLLNELDFSAGDLGLVRKDVTKRETADEDLIAAVLTDYTEKTVSSSETTVDEVHITISLPIECTEGQGETVKFYYVASGVQNTTTEEDVVRFQTDDGKEVGFTSLKEAVEYANENGVTDIPVVGDTLLEEGEIKIDNLLNFKGVKNDDGEYPVLNGARFIIENSAAATFENINFTGESYIDVSKSTVLKLDGCHADIRPCDYFNSQTREFEADSAFIVSSSTLTPVRLTLTNSTVITGAGSALNIKSLLADGSVISGNTFGSEKKPFTGSALQISDARQKATIEVSGNTFYGKRALTLGGSGDMPYLVISNNNIAHGVEDGIFVGGSKGAAFVDSGSEIGENAITCSNIENGALAFGGVDVELNTLNRITRGNIALNEDHINIATFYNNFVVGSTLRNNAIALYKDGELYAYLNASEEEQAGYRIEVVG